MSLWENLKTRFGRKFFRPEVYLTQTFSNQAYLKLTHLPSFCELVVWCFCLFAFLFVICCLGFCFACLLYLFVSFCFNCLFDCLFFSVCNFSRKIGEIDLCKFLFCLPRLGGRMCANIIMGTKCSAWLVLFFNWKDNCFKKIYNVLVSSSLAQRSGNCSPQLNNWNNSLYDEKNYLLGQGKKGKSLLAFHHITGFHTIAQNSLPSSQHDLKIFCKFQMQAREPVLLSHLWNFFPWFHFFDGNQPLLNKRPIK